MGAVSNIVSAVGDVVGGAVNAVSDIGSTIDDAVNNVVPGGWVTLGAAALGAGALGGLGEAAALDAAATDAALEAASQEAMAGWGAGGLSDAAALEAATGVADATGTTSPWGLNPNASSSWELKPSISNGSITANAVPNPYPLTEGMAGLTAEQVANANALGQVGSNAASGLGYLGGASSLPAGTAGITGVSDVLFNIPGVGSLTASDLAKAKSALSTLTGGLTGGSTGGTNQALANALTGGQTTLAGVTHANQNPFNFGTQLPIQGSTTTSTQPVYLTGGTNQALANLLKGQ